MFCNVAILVYKIYLFIIIFLKFNLAHEDTKNAKNLFKNSQKSFSSSLFNFSFL
jgi:hypothetical protein